MTSQPPPPGQPLPGTRAHVGPPPHPPAPPSPPPPAYQTPFASTPAGTVVDGRYLLEGRIATGGMGEVWRGIDQILGRPVAVKLLRPEYASDETFLVRFRGEARHAANLNHPGVAFVYDYGEVTTTDDHPTAYLVMELVDGEPLSAVLHREKRLPPERTLEILEKVADALQAAHDIGVVHRDVKPGNLLITRDGAVKVTDFGIARAVDAAPLTATGIMMGTAYYVSPEQASGRPVTPASDLYSLGVVAYECLAGRRPFDDRNPIVVVMAHQQDTPAPLPPDVPYNVRALVEATMSKDPGRRPASARTLARTAAGVRRSLRQSAALGHRPGQPADVTAAYGGPSSAPDPFTGMADRPQATGRPRSWLDADPAAATGLAPSGPRGVGEGPPADRWGGRPAGRQAAHRPGDTSALPLGWAGPGGAGPRGGRRRRSGRRRIPLPVLVALLVLTVIVSALVTRQLAGGSDTSNAGAPKPGQHLGPADTAASEGGIVSGYAGVTVPATDTPDGPENLVPGSLGGVERPVSALGAAPGGGARGAGGPWGGDDG